MTTNTANTPTLLEEGEEDIGFGTPHPQMFYNIAGREEWERFPNSPICNIGFAELENWYFIVPTPAGTADHRLEFIQYGEDSDALIVVGFGESETDLPKDHWEAVLFLRKNGRPILADKLIAMLQVVEEDPDVGTVSIVSLRDMARIMVDNGDFADPSISPDDLGIVHAQWRIFGNGLLVISFIGHEEILVVAQADGEPQEEDLDISKRGQMQEILREYGHLVPLRHRLS